MGLQPNPERFGELERQLKLFAEQKPISIRSAAKLADMMAAKAAIIKDELEIALKDDPDFRSGLGGQFKAFKANLLPHLAPDEFADLYAETITYGMFAARFHDTDLGTFSRQEAMENLPASNPFLKGLFRYIAGDLPKRLEYVVDDLVQVMRASDPHSLFKDFGKFTARNDPFVHFYEDFLAAYNPRKRKSRGVWYTPEPVVDFIVRAVDEVLKTEFGLADGLADTSKVTVDWDTGQDDPKTGKPRTIKKDVHKVQILDPATGTGTFLAKAVQLIADRVKARAPGKWSSYVEQDLLPRLHGFELLMASYAMCHMKLDMMLSETGYKPSSKPPRLSVWLTNALEPAEREVKDLFFQPLADEARGASEVKRQTPIMCVIGNPPYSGHSSNFGDWIEGLMAAYKISPELKRPAQAKWLSDDYVKFIRMSEHLIERNGGGGVLGFITNHSYLDNATFVDMRRHLLATFDKIYVFDMHGNATKNEQSPDGQPDKNVFDIRQGVSLIVGVRSPDRPREDVGAVLFREKWGSRSEKYDLLWSASLSDREFLDATPEGVPWNFKPQSGAGIDSYQRAFSINDLFAPNGSPAPGIVTTHDDFAISETVKEVGEKIGLLLASPSEREAKTHFRLCGTTQWNYARAKRELAGGTWKALLTPILYRPFDTKMTVYDRNVAVHRRDRVMRHYVGHPNMGIISGRQGHVVGTLQWNLAFVSKDISDFNLFYRGGGVSYPLYLYPDESSAQTDAFGTASRTINFDPKLYTTICKAAGIDPADQAGPDDDFRATTGEARPSEVKLFDYIYGVLHSPAYRETFAEFLKIDFPRIPYPPSPEVFRHVSEKGEQLRRLHLMEPAAIGDAPYPYVGEGDDTVASGYPKWEGKKVYINKDQHFAEVPKLAWDFYIGGYQPAKKWLKDRRGRPLSFDDIMHYQRIVKVMAETDRVMKEIELPWEGE
jgi:predicted helicase